MRARPGRLQLVWMGIPNDWSSRMGVIYSSAPPVRNCEATRVLQGPANRAAQVTPFE
jgi:hypothetical protein